MGDTLPTVRAAVVQAAPCLLRPRGHRREGLPPDRGGRGPGRAPHPLPRGLHPRLPPRPELRHRRRQPHRRRAGAPGERYWANAVDVPARPPAALGEAARAGRRLPGDRRHRARQRLQPRHALLHAALLRARTAGCWASTASSSRPPPSASSGARATAAR